MKIPGLVQLFVLLQRTQVEQKEGAEFVRPVQLGLEQLIQVRFEEAESRTLSETGPMSYVVFCWEGEVQLPCDSQAEGKQIAVCGEGDSDMHTYPWDVCGVHWKNWKEELRRQVRC